VSQDSGKATSCGWKTLICAATNSGVPSFCPLEFHVITRFRTTADAFSAATGTIGDAGSRAFVADRAAITTSTPASYEGPLASCDM
jgi:hypothetical protein